jgi:hypothetical protein
MAPQGYDRLLLFFPHFEGENLPDMPPGFRDISHLADYCPRIGRHVSKDYDIDIGIEHSDSTLRESLYAKRYTISVEPSGQGFESTAIFESDDWDEILAWLDSNLQYY